MSTSDGVPRAHVYLIDECSIIAFIGIVVCDILWSVTWKRKRKQKRHFFPCLFGVVALLFNALFIIIKSFKIKDLTALRLGKSISIVWGIVNSSRIKPRHIL